MGRRRGGDGGGEGRCFCRVRGMSQCGNFEGFEIELEGAVGTRYIYKDPTVLQSPVVYSCPCC